ncbi:hypothetical protein [Chitinolyticbacter albus]|uniref:hypothetical protein n=1 Tax=Chitinolyticbacter albus TaxID=2961951 RepID=UPI0021092AC6|nr:hypothetical protein [Chitinolyticbacter albus]
MKMIGFDEKFSLLCQEAFLTKNTLLSGFDLLLKANFFQDREGYFYSAFFNISIGMERILKIAIVTNYILENGYKNPTLAQQKELRDKFGHKIELLYQECQRLREVYCNNTNPLTALDEKIIGFLHEYAVKTRYHNLNEVCEPKNSKSPLSKWLEISKEVYEKYTPPSTREKAGLNLLYKMDREGITNKPTNQLDSHGQVMFVFDILHCQYIIEKSRPLIIWRIVEILQPMHFLLWEMSRRASEYEINNNIKTMVIPHYEDFFYFLLADKADIKRRKKWLDIFNRY